MIISSLESVGSYRNFQLCSHLSARSKLYSCWGGMGRSTLMWPSEVSLMRRFIFEDDWLVVSVWLHVLQTEHCCINGDAWCQNANCEKCWFTIIASQSFSSSLSHLWRNSSSLATSKPITFIKAYSAVIIYRRFIFLLFQMIPLDLAPWCREKELTSFYIRWLLLRPWTRWITNSNN